MVYIRDSPHTKLKENRCYVASETTQDVRESPPNAIESYLRNHTANNSQRTKYLVYECSRARGVSCYGWSDRLAGIVTTFIISVLTNRHFLIYFDMPCSLQDYLIPAEYDWRYNSSITVNRTKSYHNIKNWAQLEMDKYISGGVDFNEYFTEDIEFLMMNWDFIYDFRNRPSIESDMPMITKFHQADIYKGIYKFLFKLSPLSVTAFNEVKKTRNKMACAHVRVGQNPNMPHDGNGRKKMPLEVLWRYFDSLNKEEFDLFVASDTDSVKEAAKNRYPDNIIDTPGNITHIDQRGRNDPSEGFLKQLLDFYILMKCDKLIITEQTGFGILASFIRNMDDGLYCWRRNLLIPCSKYTVNDIFRSGKFTAVKPKQP
ncbi:uncharacterized protein [Argopecten irradians]|uniref:uncharacterized protein n=1 Tax=Argopecten irradians TaxID=31199 RepID=UPI00371F8A63